ACKALLDRNPNPSLDDIKQGLSGNLCKCGTYTKIFRAVQDASKTMGRS
ncbi:MAG: 2Fe-2S iron-sulfur cluster-binding protein, partial [Terriglobia bacterium]